MVANILIFNVSVVYWYLSLVNMLVLLFIIDEMGIFGKITSVLFAESLFMLCFLILWHLAVQNNIFKSINDNNTFFLLALFLTSTASAVSLCVATVLRYIIKTLSTRKEKTDGNQLL